MLDTKLVLIEGFPGAGKSTTNGHIGTVHQQRGIACRWFLEEDDPNPIACLDFEIKGLPGKMIPLWSSFTEQCQQEQIVKIMDARCAGHDNGLPVVPIPRAKGFRWLGTIFRGMAARG